MATSANRNGDTDKWKGVFPAVPTPFNYDGSINEAAYRAILEDNISHGVHGFWTAGGTGEGAIMNDQQRTTVARITGEVCNGRVLAIMHVGAPTTESAMKAARAARDSGCAAICCVPPIIYKQGDDAVIEHYQRVADAADLPFFAYNLPQMTQTDILPPLMEKIQKAVPQLTGLKHSAPGFMFLQAYVQMGLRAFIGNGMLLLPALAYGGIGVVDAPPGAAPWTYVELFEAWEARDIDTAMARQAETIKITDLVRMFGTPAHNVKVIFGERTGVDCGAPLPPIPHLEDDQKRVILARAEELGLLKARVAV